MRIIYILAISIISTSTYAVTFSDAVSNLQRHESIESIVGKSRATSEEAGVKGSWGDPKLKVAAKNFPEDSLKQDQTPMTGIEFGISQKVSLTTKSTSIIFSSLFLVKTGSI